MEKHWLILYFVFVSHLDENERAQLLAPPPPHLPLPPHTIIQQGEKGENFYIIDKGEVNVSENFSRQSL